MPLLVPPPRIKPWVRKVVTVVDRCRVFDVLNAATILPSGEPCPHPIYTISCNTSCNVLAITANDEAVFVWQYRHGTDAMSLEIPGGMIDTGEALLDGAARELREETGYEVDSLAHLQTVYANPSLQNNLHHTFVGRGARLTSPPPLSDVEECEVALVKLSDLASLLNEGYVTNALCVAAIERFLRDPQPSA
jgi:ADP-ribose pyrophosphatase